MRYLTFILLLAFWVETPFSQDRSASERLPGPDVDCGERPQTYTVKPGDMLVEIGGQFGSTLFWEAIYIANADLIENPDLIFVGQQFEIPERISELRDGNPETSIYSVLENPFCESARLPVHAVDTSLIYLYDREQLSNWSLDDAKLTEAEGAGDDSSNVDEELAGFREAFEAVAGAENENEENRGDETQAEMTQQQEEAQRQGESRLLMELDGMVLDETRSKIGRDFYDVFYSNWQTPEEASNFSIRIAEQPSPSLGTIIYVEVNDTETFRMRLQPRYDFIQQAGQYAVRQTYSHLQNNDYQLQIY